MATGENSVQEPNPQPWVSGPATYRWTPPFLVAAITFLIYLPTLSYQFVSDDQMQVVTNPLVLSWRMVPRALESNLWFQMVANGNYYRPFFTIWSILAHSLFGFDPRGWHFLGVLLHVSATLLVFALLRDLGAGYWTSVCASLFFGIHPVHLEPAAWISAGADPMVTILAMLTFMAYLRSRGSEKRRSLRWRFLSLLAFACALLTKEMAVIVPAVLFLHEWIFPTEEAKAGFWPKLRAAVLTAVPYALLTAAYLLQRNHVLHSTLAQQTVSKSAAEMGQSISLLATFSTLPAVLMNYLRLLVYPFGLTSFYLMRPVYNFSDWRFLLPFTGIGALAAGVWYWSRREKEPLIAFFGWWLTILLAPALYLPVFKAGDFVHDRYIYLASIGFVFLLARLIQSIWLKSAAGKENTAAVLLVSALSIFFIAGVETQENYWANDLVLYERGHSLYPQNANVAKFLAATLNRENQPDKAVPILEEAIQADPKDFYGHYTLALVEAALGQPQIAEKELATAYALAPEYYSDSSDGLTTMGIALSALHHYPEAERRFEQAIQREPDAALAHFYLGLTLLRTGRAPAAEEHLRKAISVNPSIDNFHWALGLARQLQGDAAGAEREYRLELQVHPDNRAAASSLSTLASSLQSQQAP